MNKCVCDICETREADRKYKVMRRNLKYAFDTDWREIDICTECFILMFKKAKEIKKEVRYVKE